MMVVDIIFKMKSLCIYVPTLLHKMKIVRNIPEVTGKKLELTDTLSFHITFYYITIYTIFIDTYR